MEEQAMLARDLVLRVCAGPTEFDPQWVRTGGKVTTPFSVPRDRNLIRGIVDAGRALGVDRLLVCRTRAEFSYESVTEVPLHTDTLIDLIRGWGNTPTDFLVCVEDFSAAVLVAANELTIASGPADFVREIVGSDIPGVREEFAAKAQRTKRPELVRAAQQYHCIEPGARHSRNRGPGPDLAERLSRRAERARVRTPGVVRSLRALRGGWNWAMVVVLLVAPLSAPELGPALPALALTFVLLFQLAFLARSRTVSFATLLRVAALGVLLVWPVALLETAITGVLGLEPYGALAYTYVAVTVEEAAKLSPLLLFALVARRRVRRLAAVDFLLLGAASGAGFQLAERLFTEVSVPGPGSEGLFLPGGSTITDPEGTVLAVFSGHAVVTGLIGAAVGLAIVGRRHGGWLWPAPFLALGLVYLEHLHFNVLLAAASLDPVSTFLHRVLGGGALTPWLLLLALVSAVAMDHRLIASAAQTTPPLPGRAPLARLRRWAHGRSVSMRVRVPADIAPLFRRMALFWVESPITLATTVTVIVHEFAVVIRAARRGPGVLCDTLRFLRERRANAMGEVRSQGRPWRRYPSQEELESQARELSFRLGLAGTATGAVAVAAVALVFLVGVVSFGSQARVGPVDPAYAVAAVDHLRNWLARAGTGGIVWTVLVGMALLSLLGMGNGVPHAHPRMGEFLRAPGANTGAILGMLAPGQVGYALPALIGLVLPRRSDRLLTR
ncbi:PrsW family glutamic-type intramembrane protease [Nocardiopsis alkaliphila]|uniref:PrsW family glutamic-type intramembrane protease n=1 Tax=Nocardiopsis alkaliphila TaxID=225762 RepID=UPI00034986B8|nr:PrsW family glutamic-type intramembrane protease [Nocardiopsis alkaliphila]